MVSTLSTHEASRDPFGPTRRLSERLRATLDLARAAAAIYVVLHHLLRSTKLPAHLSVLFSFGQEAVIVFFLMSGFVIFANEHTRAVRPLGYYIRRARRIYPLVAFACLVSVAVAIANDDLPERFGIGSLVGTLLALQDVGSLKPGVITAPFLDNQPLWSLSYEIAFYAIFPSVLKAWRRSQRSTNHAVGAICVGSYLSYLAWPNHFSLVFAYFLLWWCGAQIAALYLSDNLGLSSIAPMAAWLAALTTASAIGVAIYPRSTVGIFPVLMFRHFLFAVILLTLAPTRATIGIAWVAVRLRTSIGRIASISYGLYVLHWPILLQWRVATRSRLGLLLAIAVLVLTAIGAERGVMRIIPKAPKN